MMSRHSTLAAIGILIWSASPTPAQIPAIPDEPAVRAGVAGDLKVLTHIHDSGDWGALQDSTRRIMREILPEPGSMPGNWQPFATDATWLVVFATPDRQDPKKLRLVRYIAGPGVREPFSRTLDGVRELYEIVLTNSDVAGELVSSYSVVRKPNPLDAEIPSAIKKALDPTSMVKVLPPDAMGSFFVPEVDSSHVTAQIRALVRRVRIPERRAEITATHSLRLLSPPGLGRAAAKTLQKICARWSTGDCTSPLSPEIHTCGIRLAKHLNAIVQDAHPPPADKFRIFGQQVSAALEAETSRFLSTNCENQSLAAYAFAESIEKMFVATVTPTSAQADGEMTLQNVPKQVVGFGLASAFLSGNVSGSRRAKVNDDGKYSLDPLGRSLTMVTLNLYPLPVRSQARRSGIPHLFAGITMTPEFGVALGGGIEIWNRLSIVGGRASLIVERRPSGTNFGDAAQESDPLDAGISSTWFAGFGYKFE